MQGKDGVKTPSSNQQVGQKKWGPLGQNTMTLPTNGNDGEQRNRTEFNNFWKMPVTFWTHLLCPSATDINRLAKRNKKYLIQGIKKGNIYKVGGN